jgi:putrescine transport system ATP-binding protein
MIGGFTLPSAGRIRIGGADVTSRPPYLRPVNTVFQDYALFPHMSLRDNVAYPLMVRGVGKAERVRKADELLALVQLPGIGDRRPSALSGGQRQRVALARALIGQPQVLLLDEPLGALDKKLREHTQFELINIQETLGVTFIVVTHDQEEAMTLSTRIGLMNHGEIVQVGTPTEIYEYPNSRFVTEFIGSVNMFEGRLVEDEPSYVRIESDDLEQPIYVDHGVSSAPGATVWAAIRPEKVHISRERPDGGDNWTSATVRDIAYMGDLSIYLLKLPSGKIVRVTQPNVYRHADERVTWDEQVYLRWDATSPVVVLK